MGSNSEGQLGVGDPALAKSSAPLLVEAIPKDEVQEPVQVSCGANHTAVLMSNGDVYAWGQGSYGATGLASTQNIFTPMKVEVKGGSKVRFAKISCGKRHSMAIDSNGTVFVTGDNSYRQLAFPHQERTLDFQPLADFPHKAKDVSAGADHSLVLTSDNRIFAVGNNKSGNLGLGHNYSSDSYLMVHGLQVGLGFKRIAAGRHSAAVTHDGRLFIWGPVFAQDQPLLLPQELKSNKMILDVSVGEKISAIIDEDFHVYTWGVDNQQGQLGRLADLRRSSDDQQMP